MQDTEHDAARPELTYRVVAMPADTNAYGDIFDGWLMSQIDIAGSVTEREYCLACREVTDYNEYQYLIGLTREAGLSLERIVGMPIIARDRLDLDKEYVVRINVRLDVEALPLPMRPIAYIRRDWKIASEPWEWRLRP